jgi:hypothetical protein
MSWVGCAQPARLSLIAMVVAGRLGERYLLIRIFS